MSRQYLSGFIGGAIVVLALAFGVAFAAERGLTPKKADANCRVTVGIGRITATSECYNNRVMVGSRSNYILCSDITVSCD